MIINFPSSQVTTQQSGCAVTVNGNTLPCTVINSSAILTTNLANTAIYTVTGLLNQLSYSSSTEFDLIHVSIGSPYTRAATVTSSTTFISPALTLGTITMNSIMSSSLTLLNPTKVTYNYTI